MLINKQTLGFFILFLADLFILGLIFTISVVVRFCLPTLLPEYPAYLFSIADYWWFYPVWMATLVYEGAYFSKFTFWDEVKFLWKVSIFSTIIVLAIVFLGKLILISRTVIVLIGFLSLVIFPVLRIAAKRVFRRLGLLQSKVLILGAGAMGQRALKALQREPNLGYQVVGFVDDAVINDSPTIEGIKVHAHLSHIERYVRNCDIQDIVIALPDHDKDVLSDLVNKLQHKASNILYFPDLAGLAVMGTEFRHFFHDQAFALEIKNNLAHPVNYALKRSLDLITGIALCLLLLVPIGVISLFIKLTSKGPAIFVQERIGRNRKLFKCYKFRTMHLDADRRLEAILRNAEAKKEWETFWKLKDDPRVTPVGKFLRRTSLDELPQTFNILKGEMSLVGPRPYLPREWDALQKHSEIIHSVQPGITGLWQVSGRSESSYEQRLSLDSWYVRNWNIWLDIVILIKTIKVVLKKEGAL